MKTTLVIVLTIAGILTVSDSAAVAAPGVSMWNRTCIRFYAEWKKKPKHKAFAVATSTISESCGGTWNAPSIEAAKEGAKRWCKKSSTGGASCRVTKAE